MLEWSVALLAFGVKGCWLDLLGVSVPLSLRDSRDKTNISLCCSAKKKKKKREKRKIKQCLQDITNQSFPFQREIKIDYLDAHKPSCLKWKHKQNNSIVLKKCWKEHFSLKEWDVVTLCPCLCLASPPSENSEHPLKSMLGTTGRKCPFQPGPVLERRLHVKVTPPSFTSNSRPSLMLLGPYLKQKPADGSVKTSQTERRKHRHIDPAKPCISSTLFFLEWLNVNESQTMIFPHSGMSDGVCDGPRRSWLLIREGSGSKFRHVISIFAAII